MENHGEIRSRLGSQTDTVDEVLKAGVVAHNCNAWTSSSSSDQGTRVNPIFGTYIGPWYAQAIACDQAAGVWCVQD